MKTNQFDDVGLRSLLVSAFAAVSMAATGQRNGEPLPDTVTELYRQSCATATWLAMHDDVQSRHENWKRCCELALSSSAERLRVAFELFELSEDTTLSGEVE